MTSYLGKIASNGRFSIVIDRVVNNADGKPFAFCGFVIGWNGSSGQSRGIIQASRAKISEYLNAEGEPV